ncbi:MAG: efflux RND transporter periplasmic adaptor subunit [Deltaproteobacteria bacterium]
MFVSPLNLLAVLLALLVGVGCSSAEATAASSAPAPEVSVAEVIAQPLHDWEEFTGRLEERERVEVRPRVGGFIDSVHFEDGARVHKGQLLFRIDPRPFQAEVERWSGEVERVTAQHGLAQLNHARGKRLLADHVIAQDEGDRLDADEAGARGALAASAASLREARLNQEFTDVRSPIDGRASRALIRPGNLVSSANLLTTVVSEGSLFGYFDADERTYQRLTSAKADSAVRADPTRVFLAVADESGYPHEGRLDFVDNAVDPRTGMITLRALFENKDNALTSGLFARLQLVLPRSADAVLIEDRAVGTDLGKKFVLVLRSDETLEYREVALGAGVGGLRRVKQGLRAGDVIVVNGHWRVRPGMKVAAKRVAMNLELQQLENVVTVRGPAKVALTEPAATGATD